MASIATNSVTAHTEISATLSLGSVTVPDLVILDPLVLIFAQMAFGASNVKIGEVH